MSNGKLKKWEKFDNEKLFLMFLFSGNYEDKQKRDDDEDTQKKQEKGSYK